MHGHCRDRFGVQWILDYTGDVKFELPSQSKRSTSHRPLMGKIDLQQSTLRISTTEYWNQLAHVAEFS